MSPAWIDYKIFWLVKLLPLIKKGFCQLQAKYVHEVLFNFQSKLAQETCG